ncbi:MULTISPECIES: transketolase family protein [Lacrimispora]|uniref:Transketolase n=1 Tax=Lacrimispora celerecrescens TaxID=29354 RepID=A0A084JSE3_9FIRM|nr:transketolase C-terminal domain-containing protein [Lacrimispora celerecrescens]KEZ91877.1 transketolase [Lacrimispora celerecrescens]
MKKVAIRDAYGEALKKLGLVNEKIIALEADVGASTKSAVFGKEFPDRYFNVGISEMNMTAMAAGFALEGFVPFVNTFASFLTTRGADPIQCLIAYDRLNVKLAGTYCGLSDSYDGASHHSITDMAFVRAIPGVTVVSVSDAVETEKAVFALAEYEGPVYLRLSRAPAPVIYDETLKFEIGKGIVIKEGSDVTIIATGTVLHKALEAAKLLSEEGIEAAVIDMHTVKPIDRELIYSYAKKTGAIVTVEEHSIHGGLGSAVAEVLVQECPVPVEIIGAEEFAESGDYEQLLEKYGYSSREIGAACRKVMARK